LRPRPWNILLWVLFVSTTASVAHASEREVRRGTLLIAGRPEAPPVVYVASGTVSRVRFMDLQEPRALPGPEFQERVEVAPLGEDSLVISPVRDLAQGERLLLPVTGHTKDGEFLTLTLALVTREDEVDAEAWVSRVVPLQADTDESHAISNKLLASHGPGGTRPRLALDIPRREQAVTYAWGIRASASSVLQMDELFFVTVLIQPRNSSTPWQLIRARMEVGCNQESSANYWNPPLHLTSGAAGQYQLHTLSAPLPEGVDCFSLTLEEDGPRTLRLRQLRVSP
jgi:uncharacterized protein DUF2381